MLENQFAAARHVSGHWMGRLLAGVMLQLLVAAPWARAAAITTFDPPNSTGTRALAIDGSGAVAGYYGSSDGAFHGFVRSAGGAITSFDAGGPYGTYPSSINSSGRITGRYLDSAYVSHGFVRASDGSMTTFDPPGSIATYAFASNEDGYVVGSYVQSDRSSHGYLRDPDGAFVSFAPPGDQFGVAAASINTSGIVAGTWFNEANKAGIFKRDLEGSIAEPEPVRACPSTPDASCPTFANALNGHDVVAGSYVGEDGMFHGFASKLHNLAHKRGQTILFDPDGSTGTFAMAINSQGVIAGYYADSNHTLHGFLRSP
jgi:uncharacterized membrane protein